MIAFDVGNGSVKYARFEHDRRVEGGRLLLDADFPAFAGEPAAAVSVNPAALGRLKESVPGLRVVGDDLPLPLPVLYDPPEACGRDRVMAVLGALRRVPEAPAVLVIDAGTCLTATLGVRDRGVLGGAIAPGPELMARALADGTAGLPHVAPGPPPETLGRSTHESIRVGIDAAIRGAVIELIRRARGAFPDGLAVVAAGTGAGPLAAACPEVGIVHPFAVLWGVYWTAVSRPA